MQQQKLKAGRGTVGEISVFGILQRGGVKAIALSGTSAKAIHAAISGAI